MKSAPSPVPEFSNSSSTSAPLPPLFAREKRLLGWQGLTLTHPEAWFLRTFGGNHEKGTLRLTDDDGLRLEILWEKPARAADIQSSIEKFLDGLGRAAKKQKADFRVADHPDILPRKNPHRTQLFNFGWTGHSTDPLANQGWGAAWQCDHCGRVIVAHLVGRQNESTAKTQSLAREVLGSLQCHGVGGWETWGAFNFRAETPEEFALKNAKLMAGRIEMEWQRAGKHLPIVPPWARFDERLRLTRVSAASVLLDNEELIDWTLRTVAQPDRKRKWTSHRAQEILGHPGFILQGRPSELRAASARLAIEKFRKRAPVTCEMRVWHDENINKIFLLESELRPANEHVAQDVLDSIESS